MEGACDVLHLSSAVTSCLPSSLRAIGFIEDNWLSIRPSAAHDSTSAYSALPIQIFVDDSAYPGVFKTRTRKIAIIVFNKKVNSEW